MGRVLEIILSLEQQRELEQYYRESTHYVLRQRCQIILLKATHRKTSDICEIVGIKSQHQVNKWIKRYKNEFSSLGINSLRNLSGQGRKPIFDREKEATLIQNVVKTERQKLANAKLILENDLNKTFSIKTLKNFLKALAGDINE